MFNRKTHITLSLVLLSVILLTFYGTLVLNNNIRTMNDIIYNINVSMERERKQVDQLNSEISVLLSKNNIKHIAKSLPLVASKHENFIVSLSREEKDITPANITTQNSSNPQRSQVWKYKNPVHTQIHSAGL